MASEIAWIDITERLSKARIEFKSDVVRLVDAPVVYMAFGYDEVLYVGMSQHGLGRVFDRKHHVLSLIRDEIQSIQVYEVESIKAAIFLENILIKEFRPKHNDRRVVRRVRNGDGSSRVGEVLAGCGY